MKQIRKTGWWEGNWKKSEEDTKGEEQAINRKVKKKNIWEDTSFVEKYWSANGFTSASTGANKNKPGAE
jgi:hypothetical protein